MANRPLAESHPDYATLAPLSSAIYRYAKGREAFERQVPMILRQAIDEVIDAPRSNRFRLAETEKTEKTYLGTKVEILLRNYLQIPKGKVLDLYIDGVETDIKNTMGSNWTIPLESHGHPALLIRSNEKTARCDVGLVIVRPEYLNQGTNRDSKKTLSAVGTQNIWWLLHNHPYPPNFWEIMPLAERQEIMAARSGAERIAALFRKIQGKPISRLQVQALAQQHDYMKRVRRNGGARDILSPMGIALLWGGKDRNVISTLGLGDVSREEFISFTPATDEERTLLRVLRHID